MRRSQRDLLGSLRAAGGASFFDPREQEVSALCDTIVILGHGRVVARGTAPEILAQAGRATLEDAFVALLGSGEGLAA
jgi:sodium transport system ATP-binding protein